MCVVVKTVLDSTVSECSMVVREKWTSFLCNISPCSSQSPLLCLKKLDFPPIWSAALQIWKLVAFCYISLQIPFSGLGSISLDHQRVSHLGPTLNYSLLTWLLLP